MCDPITAILGVASMGLGLLGSKKPAAPPPAAVPAAAAPVDKAPEPVVKVGAEDDKTTNAPGSATGVFVPTRKGGSAIGGLGRSGLSLGL